MNIDSLLSTAPKVVSTSIKGVMVDLRVQERIKALGRPSTGIFMMGDMLTRHTLSVIGKKTNLIPGEIGEISVFAGERILRNLPIVVCEAIDNGQFQAVCLTFLSMKSSSLDKIAQFIESCEAEKKRQPLELDLLHTKAE